jgi:hypothetical protein
LSGLALLLQVGDPGAELFHLVECMGEERHDLRELIL